MRLRLKWALLIPHKVLENVQLEDQKIRLNLISPLGCLAALNPQNTQHLEDLRGLKLVKAVVCQETVG
jgi:hypothetical protein